MLMTQKDLERLTQMIKNIVKEELKEVEERLSKSKVQPTNRRKKEVA